MEDEKQAEQADNGVHRRSADWIASVDSEFHLSEKRWCLYTCADCTPRNNPESEYDEPVVVIMEEGSLIEFCPRCDSHLGMSEDCVVTITPLDWPRSAYGG